MDIQWNTHPSIRGIQRAKVMIDNTYTLSIIRGLGFYSNGVDTYEVAVLRNGKVWYGDKKFNDYLTATQLRPTNNDIYQHVDMQFIHDLYHAIKEYAS